MSGGGRSGGSPLIRLKKQYVERIGDVEVVREGKLVCHPSDTSHDRGRADESLGQLANAVCREIKILRGQQNEVADLKLDISAMPIGLLRLPILSIQCLLAGELLGPYSLC